MRTLLAAAAILTAAACSTPPPAPTAAATPAPSYDPACTSSELADVLAGIDRAFRRGAFDTPPRADLDPDDVSDWHYQLRRLEASAGGELAGQLADTREAAGKWLNSDGGEQDVPRRLIVVSAGTLAFACHRYERYLFTNQG
ncbi:hypothetical protein AB0K05_25000 [Nonomuraea sp. NPDC049486]|uniref:hypothetical protein n=1 Tax=Nonomuraea sp. NPDC049486 TaxID=3155773 RepID=UPI00342D94AC